MKYHNIIALCLGIFVAALLWQYYLWPKYQVKTEKSETLRFKIFCNTVYIILLQYYLAYKPFILDFNKKKVDKLY